MAIVLLFGCVLAALRASERVPSWEASWFPGAATFCLPLAVFRLSPSAQSRIVRMLSPGRRLSVQTVRQPLLTPSRRR